MTVAPDYLNAWINLAVLLTHSAENRPEAIAVLEKARGRFTGSPLLMYITAYVHRLTGDLEAAVEELKQLVLLTDDQSKIPIRTKEKINNIKVPNNKA